MTKPRDHVLRNEKGEPFSKWQPAAKLEFMLNDYGLMAGCYKEYKFRPDRKWPFDFAWPDLLIACEVDGFGWGHQAQQNIAKAHDKQNVAMLNGWRVFRYTSRHLGSRAGVIAAVEQLALAIGAIDE